MSSGAQVALLGPSARRSSAPRLRFAAAAEQPGVRLVSFAALGLYGVLRWSTLLAGGEEGRLLALLALSIAVAGSGLVLRSRLLTAIVAVLAVLAAFAIAGVPLSWIVNLRVAVTARAIGDGISALPRTSVPYTGINHWVRTVNVLGAGVLLFDAALLLAFAPRALGDIRRAGAALPMVALATVPATLLHPALPYVQGFLLFALLAAFVWGERVRREQAGMALALCALAAIAAMVIAPAIDRHKAWINPASLGGSLAPANLETFNWTQSYGPIHWPRKGRAVFAVQASQPEYWKAVNLDEFDGTVWTAGTMFQAGDPLSTVSQATIKRWTYTLQVTIAGMSTGDVIAAGDALNAPLHLPETLLPGGSPDTYTTAVPIGPGDSYTIRVYDPNPSPAQLAAAGNGYPQTLLGAYLTVGVPGAHSAGPGDWVVLPPFRSGQRAFVRSEHAQLPAYGPASDDAAFKRLDALHTHTLIAASPYGRTYALAQRLARSARTPYAFVLAVKNYLAHGYTYSESPPPSQYPIEDFLFSSKRGYCQQFAGAMALLLRMGGVPARVAAGFTTGSYDSTTSQYVVSDLDAHTWVQAWFPRYGWVEFDPTPPQDPALSGKTPRPSLGSLALGGPGRATGVANAGPVLPRPTAHARHTSRSRSGIGALEIVGLVAALALGAGALLATRPPPRGEALVAELERALARVGRPVTDGMTLAAIERWLGTDTEAAAYVRALRLARFGGAGMQASPGQRRALRAELGSGHGPLRRLRALWALPPRRLN